MDGRRGNADDESFLRFGTVKDKIYAVGGVSEGLGPAILPTVEEFAISGLNVEAFERFLASWGKIKVED